MGKSGQALRDAKRKKIKYHWSDEDLRAHDAVVLREYRQRVVDDALEKLSARNKAEYAAEEERLKKMVEDEWEERKNLFMSDCPEDNFHETVSCTFAIAIRVLVERFHWKPLLEGERFDRRRNIVRFSDYCCEEIERIRKDDLQDIRKYNRETIEMYGVGFATAPDEEAAND